MIVVTVGTQLPFDRLVSAVDDWAGASATSSDVFAQIGDGSVPRHIRWAQFVKSVEFREMCQQAEAIVSHAGIGSVLTALEFKKPLLVLPREARWGEHRNDHQRATAQWLYESERVAVAWSADDVIRKLDSIGSWPVPQRGNTSENTRLVSRLREFLSQDFV